MDNTNKLTQALITNPTAATVNTNKLTQALITNPMAATVNTNKLTQALITNPAAAMDNTNKLTQALIGRKPRACERWPRVLNNFYKESRTASTSNALSTFYNFWRSCTFRPHTIYLYGRLFAKINLFYVWNPSDATNFLGLLTLLKPSVNGKKRNRITFCSNSSQRNNSMLRSLLNLINKQWVNQRSKDVTQTQEQRPESPTVTLTWHASKYKVHNLHQRYILPRTLWWSYVLCI